MSISPWPFPHLYIFSASAYVNLSLILFLAQTSLSLNKIFATLNFSSHQLNMFLLRITLAWVELQCFC